MKFILPLCLITSTASAFSTARFGVRQPTLLRSKVDASEAVKEALAASKEFGATSPEARVAWDIVEELDSADNSAAFTGGVSDEDCVIDPAGNAAECKEYEDKLSELAVLLEENKANIEQVKTLASEIQAIKIVEPESSPSSDTAAMRVALGEAKDAAEKFGADSTEAKLAWETVEEIASSGTSEASQANLYDECLVEALEACEALDELARAMESEKSKTGYYMR